MTQINAYLNFNGNCREAMNFYRDCLGGDLHLMAVKDTPVVAHCPAGTENAIMHARLQGEGFLLMASDMISDGTYRPGNNFSLAINCSSEEQIHSLFNRLSAGGTVFQPVRQEFWGGLFGMFTDRFGTQWMLNYEQKQMPQPAATSEAALQQ